MFLLPSFLSYNNYFEWCINLSNPLFFPTVHPCHRFYTERTPGGSAGWEDLFSFYGYSSPVEGTIAYHVMDIGDPVRHEITTNPTPQPGWNHRFTFYAYPRNPDAPPCNPY